MRWIVGLVFVAVVAAGCAGQSSVDRVSAASDVARDAGTAKMAMQFVTRLTVQPGQTVESNMRGEGAYDFKGERGRMTLSGEVTPANGLTLRPCEMVSDRTDIYVNIPEDQRQAGATWAKFDLTKLQGFDAGSFSSDPTASLDYLKSVSDDVQEVGAEEVRGVEATHYRFSVSLDRLLEKLDDDTRERQKAALQQVGITQMPIDAWIDADGLPRRIAFEMSPDQEGAGFELKATVEMFDYGDPVDIQVPSEAEAREEAEPQKAFAACFGAPAPGVTPS